jgi:hypothetical protein
MELVLSLILMVSGLGGTHLGAAAAPTSNSLGGTHLGATVSGLGGTHLGS